MKTIKNLSKEAKVFIGCLIILIVGCGWIVFEKSDKKSSIFINESGKQHKLQNTEDDTDEITRDGIQEENISAMAIQATASTVSENKESEQESEDAITKKEKKKKETKTKEKNTVSSEDKARNAFLEKVRSQLGQGRNSAGNTIYGEWWGNRVGDSAFYPAAWCAMFLSWCANEAGIAEETVGYFAACSYWQDFYTANGRWYLRSGYTPIEGDLIFFDYEGDGVSDHNGIVESVSGSKVIALEGNVNDVVARVEYDLNDGTIIGYGKPDYGNNEANIKKVNQQAASASAGAERLLQVARGELGTYEASSGWTKYGQWYQDNVVYSPGFACAHWCAMFVSWCANQAGIPSNVIKPYASCAIGESDFAAMGGWHSKDSGYTPKPGDIVFFINGSHTGIVERCEGGTIYTIEGNYEDSVSRASHSMSSYRISGYGSPRY